MKALELAQQCDDAFEVDQRPMDKEIAAELRRLAEVNAEKDAALLACVEALQRCEAFLNNAEIEKLAVAAITQAQKALE